MRISFDGIGEVAATFQVEESSALKAGDAACLTGDMQVGLGKTGDIPCGVVLSVAKDGCAGVQIGGLAQVRYSGTTAPQAGWCALCADGAGGVSIPEKPETGTQADTQAGTHSAMYLVVSVDSAGKTAVIKL